MYRAFLSSQLCQRWRHKVYGGLGESAAGVWRLGRMTLSSPHTPFKAGEHTHQNAHYRSRKACQKPSSSCSSSPAHQQTFLLWNKQQTASSHSASETRAASSLTRCTTESLAEAAKLLNILRYGSIRILGIFFLVTVQVCAGGVGQSSAWLPHNRTKLTNPTEHLGWTWSLQQHFMSREVVGSAASLETVLISSP